VVGNLDARGSLKKKGGRKCEEGGGVVGIAHVSIVVESSLTRKDKITRQY